MKKRPIDLRRDSGKSMAVGEANEPITGFLQFQHRLFAVKAKSIYEIKLADAIDPERTNIDIPDTNQKALDYGSDDVFVGRTILTAAELFKDKFIARSADQCESCISFAFDAVRDTAAMYEVTQKIVSQEESIIESNKSLKATRGTVSVPSVGNIGPHVKEFIQKADHTLQSLFFIVKVFYPTQKGMFDGFYATLVASYGKDDPLSRYLESNLGFLKMIRRARNAVEHPKEGQKVITSDFVFQKDGTIARPTIELIDNESAFAPVNLSAFMQEVADQVVAVFESMMAGLCDKHERQVGLLRVFVNRFEEGIGGLGAHVRYAHAVDMGNGVNRIQ